ncbi:MAG TPA: hypothetical protein VFS59_13410 [Gemmatimonadaceae bacterium]|nr:hypothetical protein [Gemmatimonadaceae bacterium]
MTTLRTLRPALALAALALAAACASDAGTAPAELTADAPARSLGAVGTVFTAQLRAFPNDPIFPTDPVIPNDPVFPNDPLYGYGQVRIRLGSVVDDTCLPPSPITPQPGTTVLSLCGRIFNEGGARYRGAGIYLTQVGGDGWIQVAQLNSTIPTDPCRRYEIGGAALVSDALAADMIANPTKYLINFEGDVSGERTTISGVFDGSAWGPVGARPETDPYFAAKVCSVAITP